jgi:hypothetical protein
MFVFANEQTAVSRLDLVAVEAVNLRLVAHVGKGWTKQTLSILISHQWRATIGDYIRHFSICFFIERKFMTAFAKANQSVESYRSAGTTAEMPE